MPSDAVVQTHDLDPDAIELIPGDLLFYHSQGVFAWWIRFKTWSDINHVETYVGDRDDLYERWRMSRTSFNEAFSQTARERESRQWRSLAEQDRLICRTVVAARSTGANYYPLRRHGLRLIMRPTPPERWTPNLALGWFDRNVLGQPYDWAGVTLSFFARMQGSDNKQSFCSELAVRLARNGGWRILNPYYDADATAPETLVSSATGTWVGAEPRLMKRDPKAGV